jgi:hypothetical protein
MIVQAREAPPTDGVTTRPERRLAERPAQGDGHLAHHLGHVTRLAIVVLSAKTTQACRFCEREDR